MIKQNKSLSPKAPLPKNPKSKAGKRPQSPKYKERKVSVPMPIVLSAFHVLTEQPTPEALLLIEGQSVIGLSLQMRPVKDLAFLKAFPKLKWLDASDCEITDTLLLQFPQLINLEVLLLNDNLLKSPKPLADFPLMMPELSVISFTNNRDLLAEQSSVAELRKTFKESLVITQSTPENQILLALKKQCLQLKTVVDNSEKKLERLREKIFELDHRQSIDLAQYLESLKQYLPNTGDLVHAFFASTKRFADQDQLVRASHPKIPWVLLQEWPQNNFLKAYPVLQTSQLLKLFKEKEPIRLIESRQLDGLLQNLLDDYFVLQLQTLTKKAIAQPIWDNISKLVEFTLETAKPFMRRHEEKYQVYADITNGDSIRNDMTMMLFRKPETLNILDLLLNDPTSDKTKQSQEVAALMKQLKLLKVKKLMDRTRKYTVKVVPFSELNLEFFNEMYQSIDSNFGDVFDIKLTDRVELFSEVLLNSFNCRDYMDFAEFTQSGETISEEFFEKNMKVFKEIVGVYGWVQELEQLNRHIAEVQPEERYQAARTFLKRLIGRPYFDIPLLKKYFPKFNFELGKSLIDSPVRHFSVEELLNCFPDGFGFVIESLLSNQPTQNMLKLEQACKRLKQSDPDQLKFVKVAVELVRKEDQFIHMNPVFATIIDDKQKYPLLQYLLRNHPSNEFIDKVLLVQEESKLEVVQRECLLERLRRLIKITDKTVSLDERCDSAFLSYISKIPNKQLFLSHQRIFELLEFSYELHQLNLRATSDAAEHQGQLNPNIALLSLEEYLKALGGSLFFNDFLHRVLGKELYKTIFQKEQNSLTLNIQRYKKLTKLPLTKQFIPSETRQILDMICDNSLKDFLEIRINEPAPDVTDIVGAVVEATLHHEDFVFNDKFYTQNLREAYYNSIIKDCLKKGLSNLAEYAQRLNKVEDTFMKKTLTRNRIPLTEICAIAKTPQFKKSELRNELVRFFKSKVRTEDMCQSITDLYQKVATEIANAKQQDVDLLQMASQIVQRQPLCIYRAFLSCLELFVGVHDRAKVYPHIDWEFFDSYYEHNHFCGWEEHFGELQQQMEKYSRLFGKYLQRPLECHNEHENIKRGCEKLKQLMYGFELDCIINQIGDALGLDPKTIRKFNYKMTANKLNSFFGLIKTHLPGKIQWLNNCDYVFCCSVRDKLGHRGFVQLKEYFLKTFVSKPNIDQILKIISYKVEFYESREKIALIHKGRAFNPATYFDRLTSALEVLSKVNILNSQIEDKVVGGWPLLPWTFFQLSQELLSRRYWEILLREFNQKPGIYLELIGYLQNQQQQTTAGLDLLWSTFELFHSELSADDLIRRVRGLISEVCLSSESRLSGVIDAMLNYKSFKAGLINESDILMACSTIARQLPFSNRTLLGSLRVLSLRGEYLNRIEKINNKLRNVLSDYDEVCVNLPHFLKRFSEPRQSDLLLRSLVDILRISLTFKLHLFLALEKRSTVDILALSLKDSFSGYQQPDLKLELVQTVNQESIIDYETDLLQGYLRDVSAGRLDNFTAKYQATEFYHIAFCTSIRDEEKYRVVCSRNKAVKTLLNKNKESIRAYRNYLAHYNFVGTVTKEPEERYKILSDQKRTGTVEQFDLIVREAAKNWLG